LLDEHGRDFWWTLPLDRLVSEEVLAEHAVSLDELEKGQVCLGNLICNFREVLRGKQGWVKLKMKFLRKRL
jgi:hypothetical protein